MSKARMEAFSDAVFAIIMTIMVLELKAPHGVELAALSAVLPVFLSYVLSFIYLGIYWNNHNHMFQITERVDGSVLWANLHLLFWLSVVPFTTAWMGENHFAATPTAVYGVTLLMAAIAYYILQSRIIRLEGPDSTLARAVGRDWKGKVSPILYLLAIPLAFVHQLIAQLIYLIVAIIWLVPDSRIEQAVPAKASPRA